jgi:hypothetical protein
MEGVNHWDIMMVYIILHNMVIENESVSILENLFELDNMSKDLLWNTNIL